jgi:hypothetical protein
MERLFYCDSTYRLGVGAGVRHPSFWTGMATSRKGMLLEKSGGGLLPSDVGNIVGNEKQYEKNGYDKHRNHLFSFW